MHNAANSNGKKINAYMLNYCIPLKSSIPKLHTDDAILISHIAQVKLFQFKLCVFRRNKTKGYMDLIIPFKGELHLLRTKFFLAELPDYSEMIFFV